MKLWTVWVLAAAVACAGPATAAVADAGANGFTVMQTVHVGATPNAVYRVLITPSRWWTATHTYTGDSANLKLDPKAGGCWCESLPGGGSVEHMTVINLAPGKLVRLRGALGPLQALPVTGVMTWTLAAAPAGGTDVRLIYAVSGYAKDGFAGIAQGVDAVVLEEIESLEAVAQKDTSGG